METPKKFGTSLFGYKKKNVNAYIMESAQRFEKSKKELEDKNTELGAKNRELEDKIATLEKERSYIADALLNAKQEAEKILSEAKAEAAKMRAELEIELEGLNGQIAREKNRIAEIRSDAQKALGEYISRLDSIDMNNSDTEAYSAEETEEFQADDASASAPERDFEPIIADGDDLLSDLEAINEPSVETENTGDSEEDIEEAYDIEPDDDEGDFEIETIEA